MTVTPSKMVLAIVVLDAVAAFSSFLVLDQLGIIGAGAQAVLFGALALGLWRLRKWAWIAEMAFSGLQIAALLVGILAAAFLPLPENAGDFPRGEFYAFMTALLVLNILVVGALSMREVRSQFR